MTSVLNVDTIVDKAGSGGTNVKVANNAVAVAEGGSATTNVVQGLAKAWTNINGSSGTPSHRDSFNHGSITDNAAGDYTVSFISSFSNANYTHVGMGGNGSTAMRTPCQQAGDHTPATGSCRYEQIKENGGTIADVHFFGAANFGDLA